MLVPYDERGRLRLLARELKLTLSTVYEHLNELEKEGFVVSESRGRRREVRLTGRESVC